MRDHSNHIELSRHDAVEGILKLCGLDGAPGDVAASPLRREQVSIYDAAGRVLADDVHAQFDIPNTRACSMDSIAVHFDDFANGLPDTSAWQRGVDWEFANTGCAMPDGFDAAIVVEHVQFSEDEQHVEIDAAPSERYAGTHEAGSRMHAGDVLAHAVEVITPEVAARIAGGNASTVTVLARPRVAFIPTGDELQVPGSAFLASGKNLETNSIVVKMKVEAWGGEFVPFQIVTDEPHAIHDAIARACETADIVVLNAGSSKGSGDWACEVMESMGQMVCHQINHGPGRHSSFAQVAGTPIVGISGPSSGAAVTLGFYLRPVMQAMLAQPHAPRLAKAVLAEEFPSKKHKEGSGCKGGDQGKLPGEKRPKDALEPGSEFFTLRPMNVEVSAEGTLQARPVKGFWGSPEANAANGLFMFPTGGSVVPPQVGDIIDVELI